MNIISVFKLFLDLLLMSVLLQQILLVYNAQVSYQKYGVPLVSLKCFSIIDFARCFFFIFASYNIFHWIHLVRRISVVLSGITYHLFSRFYLMFVTVFTATLVRILCGGIYRHFTMFYFAFATAFTTTLVCIFTGSIYRHFSQFNSFSAAVFTAALASCYIYIAVDHIRLSISLPVHKTCPRKYSI